MSRAEKVQWHKITFICAFFITIIGSPEELNECGKGLKGWQEISNCFWLSSKIPVKHTREGLIGFQILFIIYYFFKSKFAFYFFALKFCIFLNMQYYSPLSPIKGTTTVFWFMRSSPIVVLVSSILEILCLCPVGIRPLSLAGIYFSPALDSSFINHCPVLFLSLWAKTICDWWGSGPERAAGTRAWIA